MNKMICGNTQAEINHDTQADAKEQEKYAAQYALWLKYVNALLDGQEIEDGGITYNLADRMANEYEEFSDFVNQDYDFMEAYKKGEFCEGVMNLFRAEARTLASIIVG